MNSFTASVVIGFSRIVRGYITFLPCIWVVITACAVIVLVGFIWRCFPVRGHISPVLSVIAFYIGGAL